MSKIVALALSGGVDSSVAAVLLREQYDLVIGASHYIWPESRCCSIAAFNRAKYICNLLNMPYYIIDLEREFKTKVVDNFISTYLKGATPNPCVLCNAEIRFTLFYRRLAQKCTEEGLLSSGENLFFATGHYVRLEQTDRGWFLKKARDKTKDQSYMLYRLPKEILPRLIFSLGGYLKEEVVQIARKHDLTVAHLKESQDACFVDTDYVEFITSQKGFENLFRPGDIRDNHGRTLGEHRGYLHYTVGQRSGLGLSDGPWYVSRIDAENNVVVVVRKEQAGRRQFRVENLNWFIPAPDKPLECTVKIRYQTRDIPCVLEIRQPQQVLATLDQPELVTPGQSAVFYSGELVIGGGIIAKA
ncbi:MAG: tRNA 2-thiouridine(34) synthase MnmA [Spirochaetales bacterium]|nr:tRNA 2-thiouridine(34) synthase MnmA [Spirochaetales bacterium]